MSLVQSLTKARMLAIEAASIVSGVITGDNLILTKFDGSTVNAGNVRGATGATGATGAAGDVFPSAIIMPYAGASAPTGWALCDGAAINRVTFATLFGIIGTTYGVGNGSTTFNLPNLKGRVPVGIDTGQTEFDTRGETGGAKTHTLTATQIPEHSHQLTFDHSTALVQEQSSHTYPGFAVFVNDGAGGLRQGFADALIGGGGAAHNNIQPYMALHYIIKT